MTTKAEYLPLRHKSVYATAQKANKTYTLRPPKGISKVHKNTASVSPACRKNEKRCTLESVNIKRITTSQSTSVSNSSWKKKVTKKCTPRKSTNKIEAVSDLIDEVDLTSILDMVRIDRICRIFIYLFHPIPLFLMRATPKFPYFPGIRCFPIRLVCGIERFSRSNNK